MAITPLDIQNKEFERSFRGYDIEDVDDFLDRIAKDLEDLLRENHDLKERLSQLAEKNKNYQKLEETMHNAIVVAQETAEDVKLTAKREADLIRREAESEAKGIVDDARYRAGKIMTEQEELYKQSQVFKMRFRSFIEAQLASLESEDWLDIKKNEKTYSEPRPVFEEKVESVGPQKVEEKPFFGDHEEPGTEEDLEREPQFMIESEYDLDSDPEF